MIKEEREADGGGDPRSVIRSVYENNCTALRCFTTVKKHTSLFAISTQQSAWWILSIYRLGLGLGSGREERTQWRGIGGEPRPDLWNQRNQHCGCCSCNDVNPPSARPPLLLLLPPSPYVGIEVGGCGVLDLFLLVSTLKLFSFFTLRREPVPPLP